MSQQRSSAYADFTSNGASTSSTAGLRKVPELWFDDGNIVLHAENSVFKVYRCLLAARSSVFRDMFAFPPPPEGNEMLDGCPIVQTYDSAQDMKYFLKAVMDHEFFESPPKPTAIPIVEGVLRLSTKYDVPHLRQRAADHLLSTYPTSLSAWKSRDTSRTIPSVENTPFLVLNLAREFDMPWLVPSVAYCISSNNINKTLDGAEWPLYEDTQATRGGKCTYKKGGRKIVKLNRKDQKMCMKGRNNILLYQNGQALKISQGIRGPGQPSTAQTIPGTPNSGPGGALVGGNVPNVNVNANAVAININLTNGNANARPVPPTTAPQPPRPAAASPPVLTPPVLTPSASATSLASTSSSSSLKITSIELPCPSESQCNYTRFCCSEILNRRGTAGFLDFYEEQHSAFAPGFCEGCLARFDQYMKQSAEEMWEALPHIFGLGGWEKLEREQRLWNARRSA